MTNKTDGGCAYPSTVTIAGPSNDPFTGKQVPQGRTEVHVSLGMSIRDVFAMSALPIAMQNELDKGSWKHFCDAAMLSAAKNAYMAADAMIAAGGKL